MHRRLTKIIKQQLKQDPMTKIMEEIAKETFKGSPRNYTAAYITNMVQKALAGSLPTAVLKNYVTIGKNERIDSFETIAKTTGGLEAAIMKISKNNKKRLYNEVERLKRNFSVARLNRLLKLLHKIQEGSYELTLVDVSMKEQSINGKRAFYKKALQLMLDAKKEYLEEKGDFYKQGK